MNRIFSLVAYSVGILSTLGIIWIIYVYGVYVDCRLAHRSREHLQTPVEVVRAECWERLNPFRF